VKLNRGELIDTSDIGKSAFLYFAGSTADIFQRR